MISQLPPLLPTFLGVVGVLLLVCLVVLLVFLNNNRQRPKAGLPGPKQHAILGLVELFRAKPNAWLGTVLDWHRTYGKRGPWTIGCFGRGPNFFLTTPADVKYMIATKFANFEKASNFKDRALDFLGNGIFRTDGAIWRASRKSASHFFSLRMLRETMAPMFVRHGRTFLNVLQKASEKGKPVDIKVMFFKFTMDAMAELSFGLNVDSLSGNPSPFAPAFDRVQEHMLWRASHPFWKLRRFLRDPAEAAYAKDLAIINEFAAGIIASRRRSIERGDMVGESQDLLSHFVSAAHRNKVPVTDADLRDVIVNFMVAGRDTTAVALGWLFYRLCKHPEYMRAMVDEIDREIGDDTVSYASAQRLKMGEACLLEALRLHPSVAVKSRECVKACTLPSGVTVNKGDNLNYYPYLLNRNADVFHDPDTFLPERWLNEPHPNQYQYNSFHGGPRLCLGKHVALLEAKMLTTMILQNFNVEMVPGQDVQYRLTLVFGIRDGLMMKVTPRTKK